MTNSMECSFCTKNTDDVFVAFASNPAAGPRSIICEECLTVCAEQLAAFNAQLADIQENGT